MVQKRGRKKNYKKTSQKNQLEKEIQEVEKWIIERRKFFKKAGLIILFIIILVIISKIFLNVEGLGI